MRQVNNNINVAAAKRPWWRPGPGTILALVIGAAVIYWQISRPLDPGMGRITYEADASGHLRPVVPPSPQSLRRTSPPPLWKPEVSFLLGKHSQELRLTETQRRALQSLNIAWSKEKTNWQHQWRGATGDAEALLQRSSPGHGASLTVVRSNLEDYSRLSEEYDRRRAEYWMQATERLTDHQRQQLDRIRVADYRKG